MRDALQPPDGSRVCDGAHLLSSLRVTACRSSPSVTWALRHVTQPRFLHGWAMSETLCSQAAAGARLLLEGDVIGDDGGCQVLAHALQRGEHQVQLAVLVLRDDLRGTQQWLDPATGSVADLKRSSETHSPPCSKAGHAPPRGDGRLGSAP